MDVSIACVQMQSELGKKTNNIDKMIKTIEIIMQEKSVDLVVFPELAVTGYECGEMYESMAEPFPSGESIDKMSEVAKKFGIHIVFGFLEEVLEDSKKRIYNSAALIDDQGKPLGSYRKSHLVEGEETFYLKKGSNYQVYDTKIGKIGIMICWDSAFPEVARILALKGAEIIAVPAAWEEPNGGDWDIVHAARSFDNVVYIAAVNHVGKDRNLRFFGKSKIVGPIGRSIVEAGDGEEVIVGAVDLDILPDLRNGYYALLKDRNPETYEELIRKDF
ncbi:MAG: carbon-nitrogen hydrolase family protein [Anaerovoracaceae bacterium]|jgi:omega-amidase